MTKILQKCPLSQPARLTALPEGEPRVDLYCNAIILPPKYGLNLGRFGYYDEKIFNKMRFDPCFLWDIPL